MHVASLLASAFRILDKGETSTRLVTPCPGTEQLYRVGAQFRATQISNDNSRSGHIFRIIENFNAEPLLPGNGIILFNRTSRLFELGAAISPGMAKETLAQEKPVFTRLARVRPAAHGQVQLNPIADFSHQIETTEDLIAWWQIIGRNFCNGIF